MPTRPTANGRGAAIQPANRFSTVHQVDDWEHVADDSACLFTLQRQSTDYLLDSTQFRPPQPKTGQ